MSPVTDDQLKKLEPYLATAQPDEKGEMDMYCPLHPDTRRSAQLNVEKGVWYCHGGCGGGRVDRLIEAEDTWVSANGRTREGAVTRKVRVAAPAPVHWEKESRAAAWKWHERLMDSAPALDKLEERRGILPATARRARIGWDGRFYKIPVFGPNRELWNIRTYDMEPVGDRRKIWGTRGHNAPRLYPIGALYRLRAGDEVVICEGEWDALLTLQTGVPAVTRTSSAKAWNDDWNELFHGLRVFICHDADEMGQEANDRIRERLDDIAAEARTIKLPYPIEKKHGKDLTDFLLDAEQPLDDLIQLMKEAE